MLLSQESYLLRQTISSNGTSAQTHLAGSHLLIQQSISQASVAGTRSSTKTLLKEGFIQGPLKGGILLLEQALKITSYPNPTTDVIYINFSKENLSQANIIIRDITGKVVLKESEASLNSNPIYKIQTSFLSSGIYLLQVDSGGKVFTTQIAKS